MLPLTLTNWLIILLATGYLTYAITENDGPLHLFLYIRNGIEWLVDRLLDKNWLKLADFVESFKDLMECYVCLSFWVALGILYLVTGQWLVVHALAVAGVYVSIRKLYESSTGVEKIPTPSPSPKHQGGE